MYRLGILTSKNSVGYEGGMGEGFEVEGIPGTSVAVEAERTSWWTAGGGISVDRSRSNSCRRVIRVDLFPVLCYAQPVQRRGVWIR